MGISPLGSPEILAGQGGGSYGPLSAAATIAPLRPAVEGVSGSSTGDLLQVPLLANTKPSRSPLSVLSSVSPLPPGQHFDSLHTRSRSVSSCL